MKSSKSSNQFLMAALGPPRGNLVDSQIRSYLFLVHVVTSHAQVHSLRLYFKSNVASIITIREVFCPAAAARVRADPRGQPVTTKTHFSLLLGHVVTSRPLDHTLRWFFNYNCAFKSFDSWFYSGARPGRAVRIHADGVVCMYLCVYVCVVCMCVCSMYD